MVSSIIIIAVMPLALVWWTLGRWLKWLRTGKRPRNNKNAQRSIMEVRKIKRERKNRFFQQNQNKLFVNPGEEAVRAGWQKRLNITVSDCDQVQVLHLNLNYETFFHVSLDFSMTNIILSLSIFLCLIKSIFSATLTHRCWSMCTWLLTSHRGTNVASSRSGSLLPLAPSPSCLLSGRLTTPSQVCVVF